MGDLSLLKMLPSTFHSPFTRVHASTNFPASSMRCSLGPSIASLQGPVATARSPALDTTTLDDSKVRERFGAFSIAAHADRTAARPLTRGVPGGRNAPSSA